ncbi:MAG TPA: hypothetical protein EYG86_05205 [Crocinitomicaceae bacterium]|nr:hypothetical protein [Crocinitomicaceae bacterium]
MALLNVENKKDALKELNAIDSEKTDFYPQVLWYKGLILIEHSENKDAKETLLELLEKGQEYKNEEAKTLIEKL